MPMARMWACPACPFVSAKACDLSVSKELSFGHASSQQYDYFGLIFALCDVQCGDTVDVPCRDVGAEVQHKEEPVKRTSLRSMVPPITHWVLSRRTRPAGLSKTTVASRALAAPPELPLPILTASVYWD